MVGRILKETWEHIAFCILKPMCNRMGLLITALALGFVWYQIETSKIWGLLGWRFVGLLAVIMAVGFAAGITALTAWEMVFYPNEEWEKEDGNGEGNKEYP